MCYAARRGLQDEAHVVGAMLVPSSDDYVAAKMQHVAGGSAGTSFERRREMLQLLAKEVGDLPVHVSEAEQSRGRFYRSVPVQLREAMDGDSRAAPVKLVWLTGGDRPSPLWSWGEGAGVAGVVVVGREGEGGGLPADQWPERPRDPLRLVVPGVSRLSSTALRDATRRALEQHGAEAARRAAEAFTSAAAAEAYVRSLMEP